VFELNLPVGELIDRVAEQFNPVSVLHRLPPFRRVGEHGDGENRFSEFEEYAAEAVEHPVLELFGFFALVLPVDENLLFFHCRENVDEDQGVGDALSIFPGPFSAGFLEQGVEFLVQKPGGLEVDFIHQMGEKQLEIFPQEEHQRFFMADVEAVAGLFHERGEPSFIRICNEQKGILAEFAIPIAASFRVLPAFSGPAP
jgi:hypothetical protein